MKMFWRSSSLWWCCGFFRFDANTGWHLVHQVSVERAGEAKPRKGGKKLDSLRRFHFLMFARIHRDFHQRWMELDLIRSEWFHLRHFRRLDQHLFSASRRSIAESRSMGALLSMSRKRQCRVVDFVRKVAEKCEIILLISSNDSGRKGAPWLAYVNVLDLDCRNIKISRDEWARAEMSANNVDISQVGQTIL
jgi:hypothetical protein